LVKWGWARMGLTAQVLKTALAAGLSWQLAVWILGSRYPYFAPLAAILTVQVTVAESVSRGGQRILGVVGGVAISLVAVHFLGLSALAVALLVLIGMAMATALGFGPMAISQVAVSGLLVMSLGAKPGYAAIRLLDTILGALVAVAVNAVVVPPDATPAARSHIEQLADDLAALLTAVAEAVARREEVGRYIEEARHLSERVDDARKTMALARQSLLYSPLVQRRRHDLSRLEAGLRLLERMTIEARGVVRSLASMEEMGGREFRRLLGPALTRTAEAMDAMGDVLVRPRRTPEEALTAGVARARQAQTAVLEDLWEAPSPPCLREAGSVMADLTKMTKDMERASERLRPSKARPEDAPAPVR
jgi:uncharacterized membrane protein YgaE (UPF0421/DUF939 family)